jgi:hypothetical protein
MIRKFFFVAQPNTACAIKYGLKNSYKAFADVNLQCFAFKNKISFISVIIRICLKIR